MKEDKRTYFMAAIALVLVAVVTILLTTTKKNSDNREVIGNSVTVNSTDIKDRDSEISASISISERDKQDSENNISIGTSTETSASDNIIREDKGSKYEKVTRDIEISNIDSNMSVEDRILSNLDGIYVADWYRGLLSPSENNYSPVESEIQRELGEGVKTLAYTSDNIYNGIDDNYLMVEKIELFSGEHKTVILNKNITEYTIDTLVQYIINSGNEDWKKEFYYFLVEDSSNEEYNSYYLYMGDTYRVLEVSWRVDNDGNMSKMLCQSFEGEYRECEADAMYRGCIQFFEEGYTPYENYMEIKNSYYEEE